MSEPVLLILVSPVWGHACKVTPFPPPHTVPFGRTSLCTAHTYEVGGYVPLHGEEDLHKLFAILL